MKLVLMVLFFPVFIVGAILLMLGYFLMTPFMVCAEQTCPWCDAQQQIPT